MPSRSAADDELVVLLDAAHRPVGSMPKSAVHSADTPLHLAFSAYVFDHRSRFLVTRRALSKRTWAGVWTNSCCGHPGPGEALGDAVRRRLAAELCLQAETVELVLPDFAYRATSTEGTVENEVCPVFVARVIGDPAPAPAEVAEWRWVEWPDFRRLVTAAPWAVSPWAAAQVAQLPASLPQRTG